MNAEVRQLLQACCHGKRADQPVLTREDGSPVCDPRCAWHNLCVQCDEAQWQCRTPKCGTMQTVRGRCTCGAYNWRYVGLLVHDLRRTAARGLRRAGVAEQVAMTITGHKTNSQYRRYDIVDNADKVQALELLRTSRARIAAATPEPESGKVVVKTEPAVRAVQ